MKICPQCKVNKDLKEFWKCKGTPDGLQYKCIECSRKRWKAEVSKEKDFTAADVRAYLLKSARNRAREKGIKCSIKLDDIVVPEKCPVLNIPMTMARGAMHPNSFTLDRVDDSKGYEPGNVRVVSWKVNYLKAKLSLEEIERLYLYSQGKI